MGPVDVLRLRLANQHLTAPALADPTALVVHLGAVQSQDFGAALWALGQRLRGVGADALERAFAEGAILRTHVLRPTWHFVAPADIRWLLALTGPRIGQAMAYRRRQLGLDASLLAGGRDAVARALEGGRQATRAELEAALGRAGVGLVGQPLAHLLMAAEIDGLICSGPRRGKQFTYALLEERVPSAASLDRPAALAELARRYTLGHGPATLRDFAWWSGLTLTEARRGFESAEPALARTEVDGLTYWHGPAEPGPMPDGARLLPNYDEYTVAYRDRDLYYDPARGWTIDRRDDAPFGNVIVLAGRVVGMWRRTLGRGAFALEPRWFAPPSEEDRRAVVAAAERYGVFLGRPVEVVDG